MSDARGPLFAPAGRYTINLSHVVMSERGEGDKLDVTVSPGRVVGLEGDDARHFDAILSSQIPVGWRQGVRREAPDAGAGGDVPVKRLKGEQSEVGGGPLGDVPPDDQ